MAWHSSAVLHKFRRNRGESNLKVNFRDKMDALLISFILIGLLKNIKVCTGDSLTIKGG